MFPKRSRLTSSDSVWKHSSLPPKSHTAPDCSCVGVGVTCHVMSALEWAYGRRLVYTGLAGSSGTSVGVGCGLHVDSFPV